MAEVAYSASAGKDAVEILGLIATQGGRRSAAEFDRKFEALFDRLAVYPLAYPERRSLGIDVRIASVWPYVVLYRYDRGADRVMVLRLLHGHRQISDDFMEMP